LICPLIGLLMLISIVVIKAIVLLDLVQHKIEAGDDVPTVWYKVEEDSDVHLVIACLPRRRPSRWRATR